MERSDFIWLIVRISAILSLIAIALAVFLASTDRAYGYELSIYWATSLTVWLLLILGIGIGLSIILLYEYEQRFWIIGIVVLLLARITIQWLPFIRGYYALQGDHMTQIGYLKDIIYTGYSNSEDFYPLTHILLSTLILVADLPIVPVANYSTAMMSTLFIIGLYLVSRCIFEEKKAQRITVASSGAIFFDRYSLYFMPNGWSIFFVPLIFYVFLKERELKCISWKILLVVMLFILPFFHPLTALYMIVALVIISILIILLSYVGGNFNLKKIQKTSAAPVLILLVSFLTWIFSFKVFYPNLKIAYMAIVSGNDPNKFLYRVEEGISKLGLSTIDFIQFLVYRMGHIFVVLTLSFIALILFIRNKDYIKKGFDHLLIFFVISGYTMFLYLSRIFGVLPGLSAIAGERSLSYVTIFTPLFMGYLGVNVFSKTKKIKLKAFVYVSLLFISSIISIIAFFPAPHTYEPSPQVTVCDVQSASWVLSNMDRNSSHLASILARVDRFSDLLYGVSHRSFLPPTKYIGDHFGYERENYVGLVVEADTYIIINQIDQIVYTTVWAPVGRFNEKDFYRLYKDFSVLKVYSNRGGDVWWVSREFQ